VADGFLLGTKQTSPVKPVVFLVSPVGPKIQRTYQPAPFSKGKFITKTPNHTMPESDI